mmetsp:Transcript_126180/g.218689  ORF Transcript_126180/g.218689 Transcript_126180/m.218689 type:complete len:215 (-) Transcript_126180:1139-1783(-)
MASPVVSHGAVIIPATPVIRASPIIAAPLFPPATPVVYVSSATIFMSTSIALQPGIFSSSPRPLILATRLVPIPARPPILASGLFPIFSTPFVFGWFFLPVALVFTRWLLPIFLLFLLLILIGLVVLTFFTSLALVVGLLRSLLIWILLRLLLFLLFHFDLGLLHLLLLHLRLCLLLLLRSALRLLSAGCPPLASLTPSIRKTLLKNLSKQAML